MKIGRFILPRLLLPKTFIECKIHSKKKDTYTLHIPTQYIKIRNFKQENRKKKKEIVNWWLYVLAQIKIVC